MWISMHDKCHIDEDTHLISISNWKMVQGLLDANLISEHKYSKWLSSVVLVKKISRKLRMCLLYWPSLKYLYPLPSIDKFVGNTARYKLMSSWTPTPTIIRSRCMSRAEENFLHDRTSQLWIRHYAHWT